MIYVYVNQASSVCPPGEWSPRDERVWEGLLAFCLQCTWHGSGRGGRVVSSKPGHPCSKPSPLCSKPINQTPCICEPGFTCDHAGLICIMINVFYTLTSDRKTSVLQENYILQKSNYVTIKCTYCCNYLHWRLKSFIFWLKFVSISQCIHRNHSLMFNVLYFKLFLLLRVKFYNSFTWTSCSAMMMVQNSYIGTFPASPHNIISVGNTY